ncbi:MAG: hypothetical protein JXJ20_13960, partial [Anaerolineae bacterium]|nr:hypothetical protein [Anaerolineae bacterium]
IPLWSGALSDEQVERTVALLTDPDRYWRAHGVAGCPATDPDFDAAHRNGCGGAWPFWNTLIAWALMDLDRSADAADLFERLLNAQLRSLREEQTFRAFYNPDTGEGLGDSDVVSGVVSLAWFARLFGAYVLGPDRVALGGPFVFEGAGMTWTQHGVRVQRDHDGTQITFPTGHTVDLPPDAEPQVVRDPSAKAAPRQKPAAKQADEPPIPSPFDGLLPDED